MKKILIMGISLFMSTMVFAEDSYDQVVVRASQKELSAVSFQNKAFYVKSFDVVLINLGSKPVDLSKGCYKAFDHEGKSFKVDTIVDILSQGILKPQDSVKGFIEFSSTDDSVYKAELVKLTNQCN